MVDAGAAAEYRFPERELLGLGSKAETPKRSDASGDCGPGSSSPTRSGLHGGSVPSQAVLRKRPRPTPDGIDVSRTLSSATRTTGRPRDAARPSRRPPGQRAGRSYGNLRPPSAGLVRAWNKSLSRFIGCGIHRNSRHLVVVVATSSAVSPAVPMGSEPRMAAANRGQPRNQLGVTCTAPWWPGAVTVAGAVTGHGHQHTMTGRGRAGPSHSPPGYSALTCQLPAPASTMKSSKHPFSSVMTRPVGDVAERVDVLAGSPRRRPAAVPGIPAP